VKVVLIVLLAILPIVVWAWPIQFKKSSINKDSQQPPAHRSPKDAIATDPSLLKKHSSYKSYHVPSTGLTYPSIRTVYRAHPYADKLPSEAQPLPLLVFIHGLGGSAAQWNPLLTSLVNMGPCLCIDLPGCGLSKFAPTDWQAYTTAALVDLLATVIESYRHADNHQGVILIGHSMGCSLAAILASSNSPNKGKLCECTRGLIALCPRITPLPGKQASAVRRLLNIPTPIFNLWRMWDRQGGQESPSVHRFVGANAESETKKLQLRFNEQSHTAVWRRMAHGLLPPPGHENSSGDLLGPGIWSGLDVPVLLITGEADRVTPPEEVEKIANILKSSWDRLPNVELKANGTVETSQPTFKPCRYLKSTILPSPASHAILFAPATCRVTSGLIQSFLSDHIDKRLSLGWQLQYLSTEGKWDVKNLAKWQAVTPVSETIAATFRAMKTMREVDERHCPKIFAKEWAGKIRAVVDISYDSPVYDPKGLEDGGVEYHKFPTVSKLPPTPDEIDSFEMLIDSLRPSKSPKETFEESREIAVHCHYGFNRTGFLIICYLIDRLGWPLQDAINEFAAKRPPGIRHDYCVDTLFVRYSIGLKRGQVG